MSNSNLTEGKEFLTEEEVEKINPQDGRYLHHFIGIKDNAASHGSAYTLSLDSRDPMFNRKRINIESNFRREQESDFTEYMADYYRKARESRSWFDKALDALFGT